MSASSPSDALPRETLYAWQLLRGTTEADYEMILCERRQWLRTVRLCFGCLGYARPIFAAACTPNFVVSEHL